MVCDHKARVLTHGLQFGDNLPHKALFYQLIGEAGVQHHRQAPVGDGGIALLLAGLNEQLLGSQAYFPVLQGKSQNPLGVQLPLGLGSVQVLQSLAHRAQALAQLFAQQLELRLKAVGSKFRHVCQKLQRLYVQFLLDDVLIEAAQAGVRIGTQAGQRLAVFQVGLIPGGPAQGHHPQHFVHVLLQLFVDPALAAQGELAQVHALRRAAVHRTHQVLVDVLAHKGGQRGQHFGGGHQSGIQSHIGGGLIIRLSLDPEALPAAAHIPVAQLVHKVLQNPGSLRHLILGQIPVQVLHRRVQPGQQPAVHYRQRAVVQTAGGRVKAIDVGVQHKESVGVPQSGEELLLALHHGLLREALGQPGGAGGVEVPAQGVGAKLVQNRNGIYRVALGFAHLLAVFVQHMAQHQHVLVGGLVKKQGGNGQQGVEPAPGLVHRLRDEVGGELALKEFLVLKGVVMLGKGHGAAVKPAVNHLRHPAHLLAAVGTGDGHLIHKGPVELNILRAVGRHLLKLGDAADGMPVAALALPDVKRRAPVAVAAHRPVLDVFQPIAKAALANAFRQPVDRVVVGDQLVLHLGHLNVPALPGVVDKRGVAAPAEGVAVLELGGAEQQAPALQIHQNLLVRVLAEEAGPLGFGGHLALLVHQLHQRQAVFPPHLGVILAKGRGNVHNARAIGEGYIAVAYHIPAVLLGADKIEQGLVFLALQVRALIAL